MDDIEPMIDGLTPDEEFESHLPGGADVHYVDAWVSQTFHYERLDLLRVIIKYYPIAIKIAMSYAGMYMNFEFFQVMVKEYGASAWDMPPPYTPTLYDVYEDRWRLRRYSDARKIAMSCLKERLITSSVFECRDPAGFVYHRNDLMRVLVCVQLMSPHQRVLNNDIVHLLHNYL